MFLFLDNNKEEDHKQYTDTKIVTIGALGETICNVIICYWKIRMLHHFKNHYHLISQKTILSTFIKSLFV